MAGGNSELAEVQEKLELLNTEYDRLNDEWTGRLAAQQDEFQREKYVRVTDNLFSCGISFARMLLARRNEQAKRHIEKYCVWASVTNRLLCCIIGCVQFLQQSSSRPAAVCRQKGLYTE